MSLSLSRTSDGMRVEVARDIDAPADALWTLLRDTTRWPEWGPSVRAVDCDVRYVEQGTTGRVQLDAPGTPWARFRITSCTDYRWTWSVSPPLTDAVRNVLDLGPTLPATGHRVEPLGEGCCRVVFEIPPLGAGYAVVCRRALATLDDLAREA
ncbi:SRPBCC family protein [Halomarina salina]|uniref:SRPBCC family protein n=1 Tax=Halomarina salina TaxID=1872699 RepID=A0ABD5RRV6_9EURY|nr:SRPBCC family protein [Halomarina salina]